MRSFGTEGRVPPEHHYIVPCTEEITDFIFARSVGRNRRIGWCNTLELCDSCHARTTRITIKT